MHSGVVFPLKLIYHLNVSSAKKRTKDFDTNNLFGSDPRKLTQHGRVEKSQRGEGNLGEKMF